MPTKIGWRTILALLVLGAAVPLGRPQTRPRMKLYVTNSLGDDITVIDLEALKVVGDIKVGERVHGVAAQADGRRLFTTIESERNLKVIDTATDNVINTIPLTGRPNQCAVTPDGRFVGAPIRDGNVVDIIDMTRNDNERHIRAALLDQVESFRGAELWHGMISQD